MTIDIVIFSRGREIELSRTLFRLSQTEFNVLVFHNNQREVRGISEFENVKYYLCPNMNYSERAEIAKNYLANPFSIICSDDDGLIESQLKKMKSFLEKNSNYSSVGGIAIGVYPYGKRVTGSFAYREMLNYEISQESAKERIQHHLQFKEKGGIPRAGMYRLYRREDMSKLLDMIAKCSGFSTPYIYEVLSEIVAAWLGKTIYLENIYWLRNWKTKMISRSDWDRKREFSDWWDNNFYSEEKGRFLKILTNNLELDSEFLDRVISDYSDSKKVFLKYKKYKREISLPSLSKAKQKFIEKVLKNRMPISLSELVVKECPEISYDVIEEICAVSSNMFFLDSLKRSASNRAY